MRCNTQQETNAHKRFLSTDEPHRYQTQPISAISIIIPNAIHSQLMFSAFPQAHVLAMKPNPDSLHPEYGPTIPFLGGGVTARRLAFRIARVRNQE